MPDPLWDEATAPYFAFEPESILSPMADGFGFDDSVSGNILDDVSLGVAAIESLGFSEHEIPPKGGMTMFPMSSGDTKTVPTEGPNPPLGLDDFEQLSSILEMDLSEFEADIPDIPPATIGGEASKDMIQENAVREMIGQEAPAILETIVEPGEEVLRTISEEVSRISPPPLEAPQAPFDSPTNQMAEALEAGNPPPFQPSLETNAVSRDEFPSEEIRTMVESAERMEAENTILQQPLETSLFPEADPVSETEPPISAPIAVEGGETSGRILEPLEAAEVARALGETPVGESGMSRREVEELTSRMMEEQIEKSIVQSEERMLEKTESMITKSLGKLTKGL